MKRFFAALILVAAMSGAVAQEAADWYMGKPIKDIRFSGIVVVPLKDLSGIGKEFKGKPFSDELWAQLLSRVYELDYFETIEPEAIPADAASSAVIVVFNVTEKPAVRSISVKGNQGVRTQEILDTLSMETETIYNETRIRLDEMAIRKLYQDKGFPDIKVSGAGSSRADGGIDVTYTVEEGVQNIVEKISFEGVSAIPVSSLRSELKLKEKSLFQNGQFTEGKLEESRQAVELYYRRRGYVDAVVSDIRRQSVKSEKDGSFRLTLTFVVTEGKQYTFAGLSFEGNTLHDTAKLTSLIKSKTGDIIDYQRLVEDQMRVSDLYFGDGYIFNGFKLTEDRNETYGSIAYTLRIEERPQAKIEDIIFRGNSKTEEFVLRRLVPLESGDVFSKPKVMEGLRNLYNTQFFSSIVPEYEQGSQDLYVDLVIDVEEQSTASMQFGMTYTPSAASGSFPIVGSVNWSDINFRGRGQKVSLETNLALDSQDLAFSFSDDWFLGKKLSSAVKFSFEHQSLQAAQDSTGVIFPAYDAQTNPYAAPDPYDSYEEYLAAGQDVPDEYLMDYNTWTFYLDYSLGYRRDTPFGTIGLVPGVVHELGMKTYDETRFRPFDSTISENLNTWLFGNTIYARAYINKLDLWYDPGKGFYGSQRLGLTGWHPAELNRFIRSDTRLDAFATLLDVPVADAWSLKAVVGAHSKFSTLFAQPWNADGVEAADSKLLAIDGTFVGRGWSSLSSFYGTSLWDNWLELRVPVVPSVLSLDGFLSAAMVATETGLLDLSSGAGVIDNGTTISDLGLNNFAYSAGVGLRFLILQFPFRLYFAKRFTFEDSSGFSFTDDDWQFVLSVTTSLD